VFRTKVPRNLNPSGCAASFQFRVFSFEFSVGILESPPRSSDLVLNLNLCGAAALVLNLNLCGAAALVLNLTLNLNLVLVLPLTPSSPTATPRETSGVCRT
jgi:hypothetical protein